MKSRRIWAGFLAFLLALTSTRGACSQATPPLIPPDRSVMSAPRVPPFLLRGVKVYPDNPLRLDFLVDRGKDPVRTNARRTKQEMTRLVTYFLMAMTIPEKDIWVNLSPDEPDRMMPHSLGLTEMGKDLLAEDYFLKQITSSLMFPGVSLGAEFWKRIYQEAIRLYGTSDIPLETFNKVWIVPDQARIYENPKTNTAYVVSSRLKVLLQEDHEAWAKHGAPVSEVKSNECDGTRTLASRVAREIIVPELTKQVNESGDFQLLRQIYNSLILAVWYKKRLHGGVLSKVYVNKGKVAGGYAKDPAEKERIYQHYVTAFTKGVQNIIVEKADSDSPEGIPRKYFSGGVLFASNDAGPGIDNAMEDSVRVDATDSLEALSGHAMEVAVLLREPEKSTLSDGLHSDGVPHKKSLKQETRRNLQSIEEILMLLSRYEQWRAYGRVLGKGIELGWINQEGCFLFRQGLAMTRMKRQWYDYSDLFIIGMRHGFITEIDAEFTEALNALEQNNPFAYARTYLSIKKKMGDTALKGLPLPDLVSFRKSGDGYVRLLPEELDDGADIPSLFSPYNTHHQMNLITTALKRNGTRKEFARSLLIEALRHVRPADEMASAVISEIRDAMAVDLLQPGDFDYQEWMKVLDQKVFPVEGERKRFTSPSAYTFLLMEFMRAGWLDKKDDRLERIIDRDIKKNGPAVDLIIVSVIKSKILDRDDPRLARWLERLKEQGKWRQYAEIVVEAVKAGLIQKDDERVKLVVSLLKKQNYKNEDNVFFFTLLQAIETKVMSKEDIHYEQLLDWRAEQQDGGSYVSLVLALMHAGTLPLDSPHLDRGFKRLLYSRDFIGFKTNFIRVLQSNLLLPTDTRWVQWANALRESGGWDAYADVLCDLMASPVYQRDPSYLDALFARVDDHQSSLLTETTLDEVAEGLQIEGSDMDARTVARASARLDATGAARTAARVAAKTAARIKDSIDEWRAMSRDVYRRAAEKNAGPGLREDQQIDLDRFKRYQLPGLIKLWFVSAKLATQLVDNYLDQRGYLPLLRDALDAVAFVDGETLRVLRQFYRQGGRKYINQPMLAINILKYGKVYEQFGFARELWQDDLEEAVRHDEVPTTVFGKRVIAYLATRLGVKIGLDDQKRDILKEWNLRYLGELLAAQSSWPETERSFFKSLLQASLEGRESVLVYPPAYSQTSADVLGRDNRRVVERTRTHNLGLLKEMEEENLDVHAWLHPNETVKPVELFEAGVQRRPVDIIRDFKKKWEAFKNWMETEDILDRHVIIASVHSWDRIPDDPDPRAMMETRRVLNTLEVNIRQRMQHPYPAGMVPEALLDMNGVLDELMSFDPAKPVVREFLRIRFFDRKAGKDLFIANEVGSCTALGSNATAIFQFLLDLGTLYAVIENAEGEARGYARFYPAIGYDGKPLLFIDTVDGHAGKDYEEKLKGHIKSLAKAIGIDETRVMDRQEHVVQRKLGGTLLEGYFNHAGGEAMMEESDPQVEDDWAPKKGWNPPVPGGIDLSANKVPLETEINQNSEISFHADASMIQRWDGVSGFVPKIIAIDGFRDFRRLLGL